jgi:hypothetical protein
MQSLVQNPEKMESEEGYGEGALTHELPGNRKYCKKFHKTTTLHKGHKLAQKTLLQGCLFSQLPVQTWTGTTLVIDFCGQKSLHQNNLFNPCFAFKHFLLCQLLEYTHG